MNNEERIFEIISSFQNKDNLTPEQIQEKFDVYLTQLKITLVRKSPFYSNLLGRLCRCILATPEQCRKLQMFTACTDGRHIIFCPSFLAQLSPAEFNFIVMHELYHNLMNHCSRAKQVGVNANNKELWNAACDGAINPLIMEASDEFKTIGLPLEAPSGEIAPVLFRDPYDNIRKESAEVFFKELLSKFKESDNGTDKSSLSGSNNSDNGGTQSSIFTSSDKDSTDDSDDTTESVAQSEGSATPSDGSEDNSESDMEDGSSSEDGEDENNNPGDGKGSGSSDGSGNDSGDKESDSDDNSDNGENNSEDDSEDGEGSDSENQDSQFDMNEFLKKINSISDDLRDDVYKEFYDDSSDPAQQDLQSYNECSFKDAYKATRGSAPMSLNRYYNSLIEKVPVKWSVYLRRFLTSKKSEDVSYSTPNEVYLPHELIRPGDCEGDGLDNISFYLDTSGSINQESLKYFFSTAYSIADQFKCSISIYLWGTTLYASYENIEYGDCKKMLSTIKAKSGGTTYKCCVDHMCNENIKSVCNVVLTDGYIERVMYKIPKFLKLKTLVVIDKDIISHQGQDSFYYDNICKVGKVTSY